MEHRQSGYFIYDYDPEVMTGVSNLNYNESYRVQPSGSSFLPSAGVGLGKTTDRYLSYFTNTALNMDDKYIVSGSLRWDGSNIFGVRTNQKGVPLWSVGGSWEISSEPFFEVEKIHYLRARLTYGSSGNVNKAVSTFPIISYTTANMTNLQMARLTSAGNPSLRWEQVNTLNGGIDFSILNGRVSGSLEHYSKNAKDLIGKDIMDPTSGIVDNISPAVTNKINYASLITTGWDFQVNIQNLTGNLRWESRLLVSVVRNKVTHFNTTQTDDVGMYLGSTRAPIVGKSLDVVYALPWHGLDHETGRTLIFIDNEISNDYRAYYQDFPIEDLIEAGVNSPPYFGSFANVFSYKGLQLSANIIWKAGHVFKRSSLSPGYEYYGQNYYHMDYFKRWQQPGDEQNTNVPSTVPYGTYPAASSNAEAWVYSGSEALITKGSYIRLQDINISYQLPGKWCRKANMNAIRLYAYLRNLGILWQAGNTDIDPEFPNSDFPTPSTVSFGVQVNF